METDDKDPRPSSLHHRARETLHLVSPNHETDSKLDATTFSVMLERRPPFALETMPRLAFPWRATPPSTEHTTNWP